MMYTNSHKRCRCLGVAAAVLFCFSVFSFSVFATGEMPPSGASITNEQLAEGTSSSGDTGSGSGANSENQNSGDNTGTDNDTGNGTDNDTDNENGTDNDTGNDTGNTGNSDTGNEENGNAGGNTNTPDQNEGSTQSRHNGGAASSSKQPVVVSPPKGVASVAPDSRAATDFTSEDLQGLLSGAGSSLPSTDGFLREDTNSGNSSGGFSNLLFGGIALILLGLAGVGLFIYRQFVRSKRHPVSGATGPLPNVTGYRPAPAKANGALPRPTAPAAENPDAQAPAQLESHSKKPSDNAPALPQQNSEPELPSGEFTDISSGRTTGPDRDGFDWDQFFKNIPPDDSSKS